MTETLPPVGRLAVYQLGSQAKLVKLITDCRKRGESWDRVARSLWVATAHEIDVSGETVRTWAATLGIETAA